MIMDRAPQMTFTRAALLFALVCSGLLPGATPSRSKPAARRTSRKAVKKKPVYKPAPPVDPTEGDNVDGDDLLVRRAAVDALGTLNGSVVVVDPSSGRVLTMVNQKLALKGGFIPCSTIK